MKGPARARWLLAATLVLASCSTASSPHASAASAPRHTAIVASVGDCVGEPFFSVDSRRAFDNRFHVRSELREGHVLHLVVDNFGGYGGTQVTLDVTRIDERRVSAVASVTWSRDYGPPFKGSWDDVFGEVRVSSTSWYAPSSLVVQFDLSGSIDDRPHTADGHVIVQL